MDITLQMVGALVGVAFAIAIFFLCRELWCWYFKINDVKALLTEIRDLLKSSKEK